MKTSTTIKSKNGRLIFEARFTAETRRPRASQDYELYECHYEAEKIDLPAVGTTYMVASREDLVTGGCQIIFEEDNGRGWPGNSDPRVHRYHGWRGTFNDVAFHGHGVRECLEATVTGDRSKKVRIVFGPDQKPEEK